VRKGVLRLAFLGAAGSFSEEAALVFAARARREAELAGASDPAAVLALLAGGDVELAVLPVANSTGGLVRPALAALAASRVELVDEVVLAVRFSLWARAGCTLADVARVASHPQAFAQCARSLARLLPGRELVEGGDTASAARDLATGALDERTAVLASARAGERYGLARLAADVHDEPSNRTFFGVFSRTARPAVE
jgi:prephenate dehydratase